MTTAVAHYAEQLEQRIARRVYECTGIKPPGFNTRRHSLDDLALSAAHARWQAQPQGYYGNRGIDGTAGIAGGPGSQLAGGDYLIGEFVYNDTSGSLTIGMPLYIDCTDAAEWMTLYSGTAVTGGKRSGGKVVLGTNANAQPNYICVGVFYPNDKLGGVGTNGDVIRVVALGRTIGSAVAYTAGTAVLVGDVLVVDTTPGSSMKSGHNTPVLNQTLGIALATGAAVAKGNSIIAVPGSASTVAPINMFVRLT